MRLTDQRLDVRTGAFDRFRERPIEITEHLAPVHVAFLDFVEVGLHVRREFDVEDVGEALDHHLLDLLAELGREEAPLLKLRVTTIDECRDDRCVCRRTADAKALELFHQACLGEARWRLREMLRRRDRFDGYLFALLDGGKSLLCLEWLPFLRLARFLVKFLVAVELDDAAGRSEQEPIEVEIDRRGVENRRRHLRRHEPLPDQFVQLVLIFLEMLPDVLRTARRIRRADCFVRILCVFGLAVHVEARCVGQILLSEHHLDVVARLIRGGRRDAGGVGTHVGDQTRRPILANINALVEILSQPHGSLRAKAELLGRILLERAGGEWRAGVFPALATLDLRDLEGLPGLERGENIIRLFFVADDGLFAIEQMQLCGELLALFLEQRLHRPVLDGLERSDLALTLDQQPQRNRLYSPCRDPFFYGLPEHWTRLVTDKSIEHAPRLLRVHFALVDVARVLNRGLNGVASDLVEQNAPHRRAVLGFDLLGDVPGDCFPFAIRVGGEEDLARVTRGALQLSNRFFLSRDRYILGLEAVIDVDPDFLFRQIPNVTDGRPHSIRAAEILADGLRLRRRLDDYERGRPWLMLMISIEVLGDLLSGLCGSRRRLGLWGRLCSSRRFFGYFSLRHFLSVPWGCRRFPTNLPGPFLPGVPAKHSVRGVPG